MISNTKLMVLALIAFVFTACREERLIYEPGNLVPKTVDQNSTLPSIKVNGAQFHSEAYGHPDSTLVVVLHGGPGGDYRKLLALKDLAAYGYRVVFYDQRGSGLSQRFPRKSYTSLGAKGLELMYDDLSAVIAHYKTHPAQKIILTGHSWGGMLATGYTGKYPKAIHGLVVAEPGGLKWREVEEYIKNSNSFSPWSESLNDLTYLDQFITGKEDQHEILDYKMALASTTNHITGEDYTTPGSYWRSGAVVNAALLQIGKQYSPDFSAGVMQFQKPVLFIYSENNLAYTQSWAQKVSAAYHSTEMVKISGTGHKGIFADHTAWTLQTLPRLITYFKSL